jgi:hypothetical protein
MQHSQLREKPVLNVHGIEVKVLFLAKECLVVKRSNGGRSGRRRQQATKHLRHVGGGAAKSKGFAWNKGLGVFYWEPEGARSWSKYA